MRVLHIHSGNLWGGIETMATTVASCRDLCPEMQPRFAICFEGRLAQELRATGIVVHRLPPVRARNPFAVRRARRALSELLASQPTDVVLVHSAWCHAIFAPVVRKHRLALVHWLHGASNGRHWLERWATRTPPDLVLGNSRFTLSRCPRLFAQVRSELIHPPVASVDHLPSSVDRAAVRRSLDTPDDAIVILQASRMERWKGHEHLLRALSLVEADVPWVAWIAGGAQRSREARYLRRLARLARKLGLAERVRFLGQRSDVPSLLDAADLYCQPNEAPEPFGLAFVEALRAGRPAVSTRLGGVAEIVDESCGLLTPSGDVKALAQGLLAVLTSPSLRSRLGAAGPERALSLCEPARQLRRLQGALCGIEPRRQSVQSRPG